MISLHDYVRLTKKGGIIDDSTDKPMEFGTVLGFCWLKNGVTGVLLNSKNYTIKEAYIGPDKLVHFAEWDVSGVVTSYLDSKKNILEFNSKVRVKTRKIKTVVLLNGTLIKIKEGMTYDN